MVRARSSAVLLADSKNHQALFGSKSMTYHARGVQFEWDDTKEQGNREKHGVSFTQARELFESDAEFLEVFDEAHSIDEERFIAIGPIREGIVVVIWTERAENVIRIISARWATLQERKLYRRYMEAHR
jgi:uncharacterized protein